VWLAGRIVCNSRARPASKSLRERVNKALNRPGHGTSFGKQHSFRRVPSKQGPPKGSFLNFLSSVSGCRKMRSESGALPRPEGHTVARKRKERPKASIPSKLVIPSEARNLGFCWQALPPRTHLSRCGNHLEILWEAPIDGIHTAPYACRVSRTVGFALVGSLTKSEIAWTEFAPLRRTAIRSLTTRLNVPVVRNGFGH
jgi:hypothetical protein